jgi:TolB protein
MVKSGLIGCLFILLLNLSSVHAQIDSVVTDTVIAPRFVLDSTQTLSEKLSGYFTQFLGGDSSNAGLCYDIAQEYIALGRHEYALTYLTKSMTLDPTNMDVVYARAETNSKLGRRKSAYQDYLTVLRDFKGEAYVERISQQFASPYKITQLTNNAFNDVMPAFSPDGSRIVFQSDRNGNWDIYVMELARGETGITRLTDAAEDDENASYSPDGRNIVFTSTRDDRTNKKFKPREIYVMSANGKSQRRVTTSYGADNWSPSFIDTTTIIFASDRRDFSPSPFWEKPSGIYTIEKTGEFLYQMFSQDTLIRTDPFVEASGSLMVYSGADDNGAYNVFIGKGDGKGDMRDLTKNKKVNIQPHLSSNRNFVTFASNKDGNYEVYKVQTDGTEPTRITYDDGDDLFPKLSSDGSRIVFCSNRSGNYQLYLASTDTAVKASLADVIAILEKKVSSAKD